MPEMRFDVRWPDGAVTRCYSPSLVVAELLDVRQYPLFEFMERAQAGLNIGAERVRLKFGFYCSAASDQLEQLTTRASSFGSDDIVSVLGLYPDGMDMPPLPQPSEAVSPVARLK